MNPVDSPLPETSNSKKRSTSMFSSTSSSIPLESKILDIFYSMLPVESLKDIPTIFTYCIVSLVYLIIIICFIFSIIYSYQILRNEKFLSLSNDAGSCSSISKVVDSQFMADIHGYWEGEMNFEYRYAIYSGILNNFHGNERIFNNFLQTVFHVVEELGNQSYSLDLAENLVIWMAASIRIITNNQVHTLQFTGDPKIVFNSQWAYAVLSNEAGNCDISPTVLYDRSVGVFTISYPIDQFLASPKCMNIINPYHFGYIGIGSEFSFRIDMQSAITAIGINTGIISLNDLEIVPHTSSTFISNGIIYHANYYFYPRYPGMTPLQCVNSTSDDIVCAISYGTVYAYPIFNHLGASMTSPIYCDCENGIGHSSNCNYFNLLPGLLFYDHETNDDSTGYQDLVSLITTTNGRLLNRKAYNASADSVFKNQSSPEWRKEAFKFCTEGTTRGCSFLTIATSNPPLATVSQYYYQVQYGSCNNTFTISKEAQQKLLTTPPTPLIEIYYECTRSKYDSFLSALGVSVGNIVILRNILILFIVFLFLFYNHRPGTCTGMNSKFYTYTNREKEKVLHFLAFNLLLSRDGLYPSHNSNQQHQQQQQESTLEREEEAAAGGGGEGGQGENIIKRLQLELSNQTNIQRFYSLHTPNNNTSNRTSTSGNIESTSAESSTSTSICGDLEMKQIPQQSSSLHQRSSSTFSLDSMKSLQKYKISNEIVINPLSSPSPLHPSPPYHDHPID